jgi:pimeloyl-ACP methyl ester carboxylesterase
MKVGSYRLFGLYPSEAQLAQIADLATSGLSPGKVGDRQTWLAAVRTVNPQFERLNDPLLEEAYKSWLDRIWQSVWRRNEEEINDLWEHARHLSVAEHCRLVYPVDGEVKVEDGEVRIRTALEKQKLTNVKVFDSRQWFLRAVGYSRDSEAFVVFRGTLKTEIQNWRLNLDVDRRDPGLHRGFVRAWQLLEPEIKHWLDHLPVRPAEVTLAGHSLGGAMAVVAAEDLQAQYKIRQIITFGSPRLATPEFAGVYAMSALGAVTRRYIHETDIVPRVPPAKLFRHVGKEYYVTRNGAIAPSAPESTFDRRVGELHRSAADFVGGTGSFVHEIVSGTPDRGLNPLFGSKTRASGLNDAIQGVRNIAQYIVYSEIRWVLYALGAVAAVLAVVYLFIRSWMRWSAIKFDTEQHDMDGYTTALAKLNDTWFKRRFPGTGMPLGLSILQWPPSEKARLFGIPTQPPPE